MDVLRVSILAGAILVSWALLVRKLLDVRRELRNVAARVTCLAALGAAITVTCQLAAVSVDHATGVANLGRVVGNCATMLGICGVRLLLQFAVDGTAVRRHVIRRDLLWLLATTAAIAVLFAWTPPQPTASLGVETKAIHPIYSSPYVYVFLGYLAVQLWSVRAISWRYAGLAERWQLRFGLRSVALGSGLGLVYCVAKAALLAASELGATVDEWEYRIVSPVYIIAVVLMLFGMIVPLSGNSVDRAVTWGRRYRSYRALFPLWYALYQSVPGIALTESVGHRLSSRRFRDLGFHLYRCVIEIRDGQLALRPYTDPTTIAKTWEKAIEAGLSECQRSAVVEAAALAVALDAKAADRQAARTSQRAVPMSGAEVFPDFGAELRHLESVAKALMTSPIVRAVRQEAASAAQSPGM